MNTNTIAVLPFMNMSSDPENEFFSDGITEEIINALAKIKTLKVISRTSSFYFKNKNIPIGDIASQLNVATVLEGSVRKSGNMIRITAQLIEAETDVHFWSETWDRKFENIFEIQDEISLIIAEKLREHTGHFEISDHLVNKQTDNADAYVLALKANYYFNKWNPADVKTAIGLYEKALELDPNHTESHVGLADAYGFMATTEFMPGAEAWIKAAEHTQTAYKLDPENAGVHYQLANLSFFTDCSYADAFRHGCKAIALKPNYPEAQQYMAFLYILAGKMEKAWQHLQLALSIDPLNQETLFYKAYYLYRTGDSVAALEIYDDLLSRNPKNIPAFTVRIYILLMLDRPDDARKTLDNMPEEIIIPDDYLGMSCLVDIIAGDQEKMTEKLEKLQLRAQDPMAFQAHSYLFLAYANLGKFDEAFKLLEASLKLKSPIFLLSFSDPLVKGLTNEPRYTVFHQQLYPEVEFEDPLTEKKAPLLNNETSEAYLKLLLEYIQDREPYLDPELTLRSLAEQINIHPNHLSWLLNERLGKNFNEFINHYRVDHFKILASDKANAHISLIGLAYESGFNSKTVFNTFFKKETGLTPSAFLKQNS
ncbi:helix-turn-helix domain-containing protein [Saccharicrinis sp. FJH62]|uniref:helix-turn-helix domain-containing protein n=1 Tax=Saccharicrinis sp. FJH62 TaxID=3344657 RepID=UPI0035D442CC